MAEVHAPGWAPGDPRPRAMAMLPGQTCHRCGDELESLELRPDDIAAGLAADPPPDGLVYHWAALTSTTTAAPVCPGCLTAEETRAWCQGRLLSLESMLVGAIADDDLDRKRAMRAAAERALAEVAALQAGLDPFARE